MAKPIGKPIPLSYEERIKIHELLQQGLTYRTIANAINRYVDTIKVELTRGGGPFTYCPHDAQQRYEKTKANAVGRRIGRYSEEETRLMEDAISKGYTKNKISTESGVSYYRVVSYLDKFHHGYECSTDQIKIERTSLEARVISLEMQVEILLEQIKELRKCQK